MPMLKVTANMLTEVDPIEHGQVHYEGVGLIGSQTLCGHTDRMGWVWNASKKRVNCVGCIAVRDHVLGRKV